MLMGQNTSQAQEIGGSCARGLQRSREARHPRADVSLGLPLVVANQGLHFTDSLRLDQLLQLRLLNGLFDCHDVPPESACLVFRPSKLAREFPLRAELFHPHCRLPDAIPVASVGRYARCPPAQPYPVARSRGEMTSVLTLFTFLPAERRLPREAVLALFVLGFVAIGFLPSSDSIGLFRHTTPDSCNLRLGRALIDFAARVRRK